MQNIACNNGCLLRSILDETVKKIQLYNEIENDLSDLLHNEPTRIVVIITKMQTMNAVLKEKLKDAQHLLHCLQNGCEVCFPDEGVKYESNKDDYFYSDSDITDVSNISTNEDDDQEAEID